MVHYPPTLGALSAMPPKVMLPINGELLQRLEMAPEDAFRPLLSAKQTATLERLIHTHDALQQIEMPFEIGSNITVKVGTSANLEEARNLAYIHSRIPDFAAPKCLGAIVVGNMAYTFIESPDGRPLEDVWQFLGVPAKRSIQRQLEEQFFRLRVQERGICDTQFGSCISGVCKDVRRDERVSLLPIWTEAAFNRFLITNKDHEIGPQMQALHDSMSTVHLINLTHSQLHPRNIMITYDIDAQDCIMQSSVKVSSILAWDAAGWYPEHWEFVKALSNTDQKGELADWVNYLPTRVIGSYPVEYGNDLMLAQWL